ncbi:MAG: isoprenyl transferase [Gammaproteobacteria bacterium]|nr:isoprenyl transferase [Gammaproteobacteria bacterium]MCP5135314.1 isoprenyl transferase [Gammaproteobacteria bacterium]
MSSETYPPAPERLPRHIAIIMDGNGRWAKKRFLPRPAGHKVGAEVVRNLVKACTHWGVEALTLFAFSSENWKRPKDEVSLLMDLFITMLRRETRELDANNVRMRFIGERRAFSNKLQAQIADSEALTADNTGLNLVIAANYGGRWDIADAAQRLAARVAAGELGPEDVTPEAMDREISTHDLPEPDLFIRTGGERRISNFLLWQLAYSELYFTDTLWPDFGVTDLHVAMVDFSGRQRRFGLTGEQIEKGGKRA